jgi:DNA-directed RNA polymerase subunit H
VLAPRGLGDGPVRRFTEDEVISDMERFGYVRLDATREVPRGNRDWIVILVLSVTSRYSLHAPDLRKLLFEGLDLEKSTKEGRLDELIIVAEEPFFEKKNLTDIVKECRSRQAGGVDEEGVEAFYSAVAYHNFSYVLPKNASVPPHRVMTPEEVDRMLASERIVRSDLPVIHTYDPPIIWNGGREGQVVEITRDSQTAGTAVYWRRIEA